jgi:transposase
MARRRAPGIVTTILAARRQAGVWDRLMDAIAEAYDGNVRMIDSTNVRVHQHAAGAKRGWRSLRGS